MEKTTHSHEIHFELKRSIEGQFEQLASVYSGMNNTKLNTTVRFSPDLSIVAVDLETTSPTPFFLNLNILRDLEKAIEFVIERDFLTAQGFELIERAVVDANSLNARGRLHKANTELPYTTTQAFIFRISRDNLNKLLVTVKNRLEASKAEPDYIETLKISSLENGSVNFDKMQNMNFLESDINKQYKLHTSDVFTSFDKHEGIKHTLTTSKTPVKHCNQVVMGITIDLKNKKTGRIATLHIPSQFIDAHIPQPLSRIIGENNSNAAFVYFDWFVRENEVVSSLQKNICNTSIKQIENTLRPFVRYDVEIIGINLHDLHFDIPTSNYAKITRVAFVSIVTNNNNLFESVLICVDQLGEVGVFNSRGLAIYPTEKLMPHLRYLKENAQELFQSNRLYVFDQIKQFRKRLGGFNNGLAIKNEHIYLP
ncbi:hypothetical protein MUB04_15475 [Acinetobacter indicus]|uniref:hypothetical protein n=1 Tax=Acinetobacter TaxID=469 RepID=UPI0015D19BBC|nr:MULTISPECIES: hypothetical protein [Acinetobacter]MCP0917937.1 hypothetical protein [Acinetobacter indicus]